MKRLLLIMPNYYGFDDVVIDVLKKYSNCEVYNINYDVGFKYENLQQRLLNAFSKTILRKNLKPVLKEKFFYRQICNYDAFDYVIVNRPDIIPTYILDEAIHKSKNSVLLLWDSLAKIPVDVEVIKKFDNVFSFDSDDCLNNGFEKIHNFHFASLFEEEDSLEYDAIYLGTIDDRIADLQLLMKYLTTNDKRVHAFLHRPKERKFQMFENVTILRKIVPFRKADLFSRKSKIVIDLAHKNQDGLSFRFFEAMILKKKVITTNQTVRNFDFYSSDNIHVIDDIENISIPESFFQNPYKQLSSDIVAKYSAETWVNTLLK